MNLCLKDIASTQMGYSFRSSLERMERGPVAAIQMKNLSTDNLVDCSSLLRVAVEGVKEHHLVRPGDLVFRSRGQTFTAAILNEAPEATVVAAPLLRIRVNPRKVLPAYLHWFINQPATQALLTLQARGTAQQMISKQSLENLEIPVPSLERQHAIVELAQLGGREQALLQAIAEKRAKSLSIQLMKLAGVE